MFYLRYLRSELTRRPGRTILTLLGLALGVGLVIAIASLSKGLDEAQSATLDGMAERTITISSLGKTFSVTGWKIGWASGPP